jgi:AcrR family transcriptional regulator
MSINGDSPRESSRSKRGVILEAAIDRFGEIGFEHTKWASIADQVGIGQTALYHYFESKAHCLLTIMRMELEQSLARFHTSTEGVTDPVDALRAAVGSAYVGTAREALQRRILQNHMDLLASPRQSEKEEVERVRSRELVQEIELEWAALIARGIESGDFVDEDARTLARLVLALVISVWRWYRPGGTTSLEDVAHITTGAVLRVTLQPARA